MPHTIDACMAQTNQKLVATSLIVLVLIILFSASATSVKAYSLQFNGWGTVKEVNDAVTITVKDDFGHDYIIKLANLEAKNCSDASNLESLLPINTTIYFDIFNQTINNNALSFTSVVYVLNNDSSHYENINKALLEQSGHYGFLLNPDDLAVTPYTWSLYVGKDSLINNTQGIDLSKFEDSRNTLSSNYNGQTLAHAGYLLTFIAVLATLFTKHEFFSKHWWGRVIFGGILGLILFSFYRLIYWSWLGNQVLVVTPQQAFSTGELTLVGGIQDYLLKIFSDYHSLRVLYLLEHAQAFLVMTLCVFFGIMIVFVISFVNTHFSKISVELISGACDIWNFFARLFS
jgi:hypothetical protein